MNICEFEFEFKLFPEPALSRADETSDDSCKAERADQAGRRNENTHDGGAQIRTEQGKQPRPVNLREPSRRCGDTLSICSILRVQVFAARGFADATSK